MGTSTFKKGFFFLVKGEGSGPEFSVDCLYFNVVDAGEEERIVVGQGERIG